MCNIYNQCIFHQLAIFVFFFFFFSSLSLLTRDQASSLFSRRYKFKTKVHFKKKSLWFADCNLYTHFVEQVLAVIVRFVKKDAEEKKESFISTPYFRLFINFFNHLHTLNSSVNDENFQVFSFLF